MRTVIFKLLLKIYQWLHIKIRMKSKLLTRPKRLQSGSCLPFQPHLLLIRFLSALNTPARVFFLPQRFFPSQGLCTCYYVCLKLVPKVLTWLMGSLHLSDTASGPFSLAQKLPQIRNSHFSFFSSLPLSEILTPCVRYSLSTYHVYL